MALSIQGTPGAAAATSITLPTHAAGDLIIVAAYRDGNTTPPSVPAAGGTVPTWNTIDGPTGANTNSLVVCWAKATANNHTSGTWTNATGMAVIVYRGQNPSSPIGGHAQGGGSGANTNTAPSVTLSKTDGTSAIVHVGGNRNVTAWGALAAGYTNRANVATEVRLVTKDTTTSDGTVSLVPTNVSSGSGYRAETVEVLVAVDITKTLGVPSAANAAVALSKTQAAQSKTLGVAVGANAAVALSFQIVDTAQHKDLTAATSTNAAQSLTHSQAAQTKSLTSASSSNAAVALTSSQAPTTRTLGVAAETGAAAALTVTQTPITPTFNATAETGEAQTLSFTSAPQTVNLSSATESDFAFTLSPAGQNNHSLQPVTETGVALSLTSSQTPITKSIAAGAETNAALHLSIAGQSFADPTTGHLEPVESGYGHLVGPFTGRLVR